VDLAVFLTPAAVPDLLDNAAGSGSDGGDRVGGLTSWGGRSPGRLVKERPARAVIGCVNSRSGVATFGPLDRDRGGIRCSARAAGS
jgi:hypothetical protein